MSSCLAAPTDLSELFSEELAGIGGRISDSSCESDRLFLRATVPHTQQVRPNDHIQGGVAVTTDDNAIYVYPYIYRHLSRNGVILTTLVEEFEIDASEIGNRDWESLLDHELAPVREGFRRLVRKCASAQTLEKATLLLRNAARSEVQMSLQLSSVITRLPGQQSSLLLSQILSEFHGDDDNSVYALMNAVTVVARDEMEAATKWELERIGGGVPSLCKPSAIERSSTASVGSNGVSLVPAREAPEVRPHLGAPTRKASEPDQTRHREGLPTPLKQRTASKSTATKRTKKKRAKSASPKVKVAAKKTTAKKKSATKKKASSTKAKTAAKKGGTKKTSAKKSTKQAPATRKKAATKKTVTKKKSSKKKASTTTKNANKKSPAKKTKRVAKKTAKSAKASPAKGTKKTTTKPKKRAKKKTLRRTPK